MHHSLVKAINEVTTLSKPQRKFLIIIINVFIAVAGNANYRNLSRYCIISEKTIARWFNKGISFVQVNILMISIIPDHHAIGTAFGQLK